MTKTMAEEEEKQEGEEKAEQRELEQVHLLRKLAEQYLIYY